MFKEMSMIRSVQSLFLAVFMLVSGMTILGCSPNEPAEVTKDPVTRKVRKEYEAQRRKLQRYHY